MEAEISKPHSIYLEGALPHESQILVSDSEVFTENVESDFDGDDEEPAVVLSSKMTLSLISLDPVGDESKVIEAKVESLTKEISPEKEDHHQVADKEEVVEEEEEEEEEVEVVDKIVIEEALDDDEEYEIEEEEEEEENEVEVIGNDGKLLKNTE